ncbi:hypothetical protein MMC18_006418 [Xylographa bjoerkii]|nr:hypothetical protein [Xylographa bjoerkii]
MARQLGYKYEYGHRPKIRKNSYQVIEMSTLSVTQASVIVPTFVSQPGNVEAPGIQNLISKLNLQRNLEGGYFVETDRDPLRIPNPFRADDSHTAKLSLDGYQDDSARSASTTIYHLLTPEHPTGVFHRNKARTMHTLHKGRGRYVIIHADQAENGQKARLETFVVGHNVDKGERLQWLVEGGKYKASFLLPDTEHGNESEGLLISETVVPGFEFRDHEFLPADALHNLVTAEQENELRWLLSARA